MPTTEFEPRMGPSLWLQTPCNGCECPPSRVKWVAPRCAGTIAGTVTDERTGEPLENVSIWIEGAATGSFGEAVTDSLGHYRIGQLEAGEGYALTASGPGYSYRLLEDGVLPEEGLVQDVALVRTGAVRGTLRDSYDQPIEGVTVYLAEQDGLALGQSEAVTDDTGKFCLCDVPVSFDSSSQGSNYLVLAVHPDYSAIETTRFVPPYYALPDQVVVQGVLGAKAGIEGFVSSNGVPVSGAQVQIYDSIGKLLLDDAPVLTDASGYFEMSVNAPAEYVLGAQAHGYQAQQTQVIVTPDQVTSAELELAGPGTISGTLTDLQGAQVAGATVEILLVEGRDAFDEPVVTDENGFYSFVNVEPFVDYLICATMPTAQAYLQFPFATNVSLSPDQDLTVDLQGDTIAPTGQIISPSSGATVSGTVQITVEAQDNQGVDSVGLLLNGEQVANQFVSNPDAGSLVQEARLSLRWDSTTVGNGSHTLNVVWDDVSGNRLVQSLTLMVKNS